MLSVLDTQNRKTVEEMISYTSYLVNLNPSPAKTLILAGLHILQQSTLDRDQPYFKRDIVDANINKVGHMISGLDIRLSDEITLSHYKAACAFTNIIVNRNKHEIEHIGRISRMENVKHLKNILPISRYKNIGVKLSDIDVNFNHLILLDDESRDDFQSVILPACPYTQDEILQTISSVTLDEVPDGHILIDRVYQTGNSSKRYKRLPVVNGRIDESINLSNVEPYLLSDMHPAYREINHKVDIIQSQLESAQVPERVSDTIIENAERNMLY